ncbi:hypothetical protein SHKM778_46830 [Streptomyces sp. KM77-8]|uniref:Uncharacterized protein n=1 Tax=Streptomyces haneummycinicus TaxID=3074435 RepID=A0AAT9HLJ1_9ACTN
MRARPRGKPAVELPSDLPVPGAAVPGLLRPDPVQVVVSVRFQGRQDGGRRMVVDAEPEAPSSTGSASAT